ncbi:hydroxylamine reductase, partial [Methanosalsum natronophilum]
MFCFQCQETSKGTGCTKAGVCGKQGNVADLQDRLIYVLKGIAYYNSIARKHGSVKSSTERFMLDSLFSTLTNTNFSESTFEERITEGIKIRDSIRTELESKGIDTGTNTNVNVPHPATVTRDELDVSENVGVLATDDEDIRSLRELLTYGLKGISAYAHHAAVLGYTDETIFDFFEKGLLATVDDELSVDDLTGLVLECGDVSLTTLQLLDKANSQVYGHQQPTEINIGTR